MRRFTSTAVLYVWALTASGSQIPSCSISARVPVSPLIPHEELPSWVCLAWKRDEKSFNANWNANYSREAATYWKKKKKTCAFDSSYPKGSEHSYCWGSTVLDECTWDDLQGLSHSAVWPLLYTGQRSRALRQPMGHLHLHCSTAWQQIRVQQDVTTDLHGILQVSLHFLRKIISQTATSQLTCAKSPDTPAELIKYSTNGLLNYLSTSSWGLLSL